MKTIRNLLAAGLVLAAPALFGSQIGIEEAVSLNNNPASVTAPANNSQIFGAGAVQMKDNNLEAITSATNLNGTLLAGAKNNLLTAAIGSGNTNLFQAKAANGFAPANDISVAGNNLDQNNAAANAGFNARNGGFGVHARALNNGQFNGTIANIIGAVTNAQAITNRQYAAAL